MYDFRAEHERCANKSESRENVWRKLMIKHNKKLILWQ